LLELKRHSSHQLREGTVQDNIVQISLLSSDPKIHLPVFNALIRHFDKLCIHPEILGNVNLL